jgi:hypothetical protein
MNDREYNNLTQALATLYTERRTATNELNYWTCVYGNEINGTKNSCREGEDVNRYTGIAKRGGQANAAEDRRVQSQAQLVRINNEINTNNDSLTLVRNRLDTSYDSRIAFGSAERARISSEITQLETELTRLVEVNRGIVNNKTEIIKASTADYLKDPNNKRPARDLMSRLSAFGYVWYDNLFSMSLKILLVFGLSMIIEMLPLLVKIYLLRTPNYSLLLYTISEKRNRVVLKENSDNIKNDEMDEPALNAARLIRELAAKKVLLEALNEGSAIDEELNKAKEIRRKKAEKAKKDKGEAGSQSEAI